MKRLIIVGAGGFAREVFSWAKEVKEHGKDWAIHGFLDDNLSTLDGYHYNVPIIDTIHRYFPQEDDCFVMGISAPTNKKREIVELLQKKGANFSSLVHPNVIIGNNIKIGEGCIISPNVTLSCDIKVGNFVTINAFCGIGHDVIIGDWCTLNSFVNLNGFSRLGEGVEVGSHAVILPNGKVGDFAKIGAGSLVVKEVKPRTTVIGVPAKRL
jgi:sugar O-acyltransferase (sialic acid O-acetyltransferase NeuD family)